MRLTELTNKGMNGTPIYVGSYGNIVNVGDNQATSMVHGKLGQLEDIEDELGIDLITLFKALKDGIYTYFKDFRSGSSELLHTYMEINSFQYFTVFDRCLMRFKDYGKTWALTKEELEERNNFE